MFTQLFGYYLLEQGKVSPAQLQAALEVKSRTKVRLGALAIDAGYMTAPQVERVHAEQKRLDKRFGDIAVSLGFITGSQVDELLGKQKSADIVLGQALIDLGFLSNSEFADCLSSYKASGSFYQEGMDDSVLLRELSDIFELNNIQDRGFYLDYLLLLTRNLVRFVGDDFVFVGRAIPGRFDLLSSQEITGDVSAYTAICGNTGEFSAFASRYAQETLEDTLLLQDSVGEFLNLQNGLLAVDLSINRDVELGLTPPVFDAGSELTVEDGLAVVLLFSFGQLNLILFKR